MRMPRTLETLAGSFVLLKKACYVSSNPSRLRARKTRLEVDDITRISNIHVPSDLAERLRWRSKNSNAPIETGDEQATIPSVPSRCCDLRCIAVKALDQLP